MSKQKLIKKLKKKNPSLNFSELDEIIESFSNDISNALVRDEVVEIRGFGRWYSKKLKENYRAKNPITKELIYKPERVKIRFRAIEKLKQIINE